tara:strand:+ start:253 stop:393 length:141 start_codon:yes stop_codon:yes gene_type:complete
MHPKIFADGFTNVTFRNGMVRIELGSLPTAGEGDSSPLWKAIIRLS